MAFNRHKQALLTWLIVYPMITVLLAILEPVVAGLALPLRTLVLSVIMVPALVYLALPAASARLHDWLTASSHAVSADTTPRTIRAARP